MVFNLFVESLPLFLVQLTWASHRYNENKLSFFSFVFRRKMIFAALNSTGRLYPELFTNEKRPKFNTETY